MTAKPSSWKYSQLASVPKRGTFEDCWSVLQADCPLRSDLQRQRKRQAGRRTGMRATWVSLNSHHLRQVTSSAT